MKKIISLSSWLFAYLRDWFDPAIEGDPYKKRLSKEKVFLLFGKKIIKVQS